MRTCRRTVTNTGGFTLLEGVFSLFITFLVLSALTYTLRQAGQVKANTKNMDQITEAVHSLILLKSDVRAASDVTTPSSGSSSVLALRRIDPNLSFVQRIDPTGGEDPYEDDEKITVRYAVDNGILKRNVIPDSGSPLSQRLLRVDSFQVSRTSSPDFLEVTLKVSNERVSKTHTMRVSLE